MFLNLTEYKDYAPDYFDLMYGDDRAAETKKVESDGSLFGFQKCEYNRIAACSDGSHPYRPSGGDRCGRTDHF